MNIDNEKQQEILADSIYIYLHYDKIKKDAKEYGLVMSNEKSHYASLVFEILSKYFDGFTKEEIKQTLASASFVQNKRFHSYLDVANAINEKIMSVSVTEDQVKSSEVHNTISETRFAFKDYALRVGKFFVIVHDYGLGERISIEVY